MAQNEAAAVEIEAKVGGTEIDEAKLISFNVEMDLDMPDMCEIQLRNDNHDFTNEVSLGDEVEISAAGELVFKGEVGAVEARYTAKGENRLFVRGLNKLHRLSRGSKSRTFVDQKDSDIISTIAGEYGLSAEADSTPETHKHVYQHNITDLAFVRQRAARNGFEVLVEDRKLIFRKPKIDQDSGIKLRYGDPSSAGEDEVALQSFSPRMSAAQIVSEVEVRAWDPEKKEVVVGSASGAATKLGSKAGYSETASAFSTVKTFTVDSPVASKAEADKLAEARLGDLNMGYITGDGSCRGTPTIKPGIVVSVTVNPDDESDRFNGKYFITGCTHRYRHSVGEGGGYITLIRFNRDGEGP